MVMKKKDLVTPIVALLSVCITAAAQQAPRLVILLTVDELRSDLYEMMSPHLSEGGLNRLASEGRVYEQVTHPLVEADPVATEAILQTGTLPLTSGVTARRPAMRKEGGLPERVSSVFEDKDYIGYGTAERLSPMRLFAPTLSDWIVRATRGMGQVFSIAPQAEEAIVAGGHEATGVYWLDDTSAKWVSSTYYPAGLQWYITKSSTVATRLDRGAITWSAAEPELYAELLPYATSGRFDQDHLYTRAFASLQDLKRSPVINEYIADLAEAVIDGAGLGSDASTDLLALHMTVGLPGSLPGEYSPEVLDGYLLLDRAVERLLTKLDRQYGRDEVFFVLCGGGMVRYEPLTDKGDHYPEFAPDRCEALTNMYLHAKYGIKGLVMEVTDRGELFLDRKLIEESGGPSLIEVEDAVAAFLLDMSGVAYTIPEHTLRSAVPGDEISAVRLTALQSALPAHRADLFIGISPGMITESSTSAVPSSPHYAAVPTVLIMRGGSVEPERIPTPLDLRSVSREIARTLHIRAPSL